MPKLHAALAMALRDHGVKDLFGVLGDANAYFVDAFSRLDGTRYTSAANENGAVLMAIGYGMVTGDVGFATVTHGPALTNCVTALTEGVRSNTPIVLMCGDTPTNDRENLQNTDQKMVVLAAGAGFEQLREPETALEDLARAVRRAKAERRPIAFNMPADFQWQDVDPQDHRWDLPDLGPTVIEGPALDNAIGIIAAARRPVLLAGRGAIDDASRASLLRLARRLDAPLATTMRAKNLFRDEDHVLGVCGTVSTPQATEVLMSADCLIAFGASLNFHTTGDGGFVEGKRVIQVMDRAQDLGTGVVADVSILGQPASVANTFHHWLDEAEVPGSGFTADIPARGLDKPPTPKQTKPREGTVDFLSTLSRLNEILPADRTIVTDAGRWMVKSYGFLTAPGPRDMVTSASYGAIGLGLATAIGAGVANPSRPTILFNGDGGFMLGNLGEFHSAVRADLDLIIVLFNDGSYGAEHIQFRDKQLDPAITLFDWPEFLPLARALGGDGVTITTAADLDALSRKIEARDRTRPFLIDVRLDPDHVAMW
ncbi:thiamine pyrophosphate-binding protein [Maritimibacter dapengensis]|uniref:Thiamine pyrophosphate-binding protein n=1 Tax=Maritimibacter dapengensis TaxID=2836868 RepID=A0ABS6T401_9RHOB|nr:thiamine pyrophosphate-binding protein [Maritimibacter dapengensis]MBV7379972.1 thiamine pyrophosphate-binding protein [Maritimibacter dapengensis]